MQFEYKCKEHGVFEMQYNVGGAPTQAFCPQCQKMCSRYYNGISFILKGHGWPRKKKNFNRKMTEKNEHAGRNMRKTWDGTQPKLVD